MNSETSALEKDLEGTTKRLREQLERFRGVSCDLEGSPKAQELYEEIMIKGEEILASCEAALERS